MPAVWVDVPYETVGGRRRVAMDAYTPVIEAVDGDWSEIELTDRALVRVRAPLPLLTTISGETGWPRVTDPATLWTATHTLPDGRVAPTRPLLDTIEDVLTEVQYDALKARAQQLIALADRDGHTRFTDLPWPRAARLLRLLGRLGYGLDRVSTGTFPTTGVLDAFTGTDGTSPPNGNWTNSWHGLGSTGLEIQGNAADPAHATNICNAYRNTQNYGPDCEAYATISSYSGNGDRFGVSGRIVQEGASTVDLYEVELLTVTGASNDTLFIVRYDNNAGTQLGATITQEMAAAEKLGIECLGDQISGYRFSGGSWALLGTRTDATYTAAGKIGLKLRAGNGTMRADDYGGGTIVAAGGAARTLALLGVGS